MRMQPEVCDDAAGGPADIVHLPRATVSRRIINPNFAINNIDSLQVQCSGLSKRRSALRPSSFFLTNPRFAIICLH